MVQDIFFGVPSMGGGPEVKSSRNLVVGTEANRKAPTVSGALKEAV
jgi:hypothetical protein